MMVLSTTKPIADSWMLQGFDKLISVAKNSECISSVRTLSLGSFWEIFRTPWSDNFSIYFSTFVIRTSTKPALCTLYFCRWATGCSLITGLSKDQMILLLGPFSHHRVLCLKCLSQTLAGICGSRFQIFEKHLLPEARFGLEGFCDQSLLSGLLEVTGEDLDP